MIALDLVPADWTADALCAESDPDAWYPDAGSSGRQAKAICARCGVREDCLQQALDSGDRWGIWGGLSEPERRALRRRTAQTGAVAA